jgi:uncharacterized coiled-coil DUF342 family protein
MFNSKSKYYDNIMQSLARIFGKPEMSEAETDQALEGVQSFEDIKADVQNSISAEMNEKFDGLQAQMNEATERLDALQSKINELTAENLTLENKVSELKQEAENKDNALKMANEQIAKLSGELAGHKAGASGQSAAIDGHVKMPGATANAAGGVTFSGKEFDSLFGIK